MKKNLLWMLAAIFVCGLTAVTLSACSSDDDKNDKPDATVEKEIMYAVQISDDVLKVANVEVNYVDQTGAKKKEALSSAQWTKSQKLNNTSPFAQGIWVKITPGLQGNPCKREYHHGFLGQRPRSSTCHGADRRRNRRLVFQEPYWRSACRSIGLLQTAACGLWRKF